MHQSRRQPSRQLSFGTARHRLAITIIVATSGVLFGLAPSRIDALDIPGEETKIAAANPLPASGMDSDFGVAVDLEDGWLVVGAPEDDVSSGLNKAGAAYVFEQVGGQWIQRGKLTAPIPQNEAQFGSDVGIAIGPGSVDDLIIVGEPLADTTTHTDVGRAYVFRRDGDTWLYVQELMADEQNSFDYYGTSVDVDVSIPSNSTTQDHFHTAVVGASHSENPPWQDQGSVHIYQYYGGPPSFQGELSFFGDSLVQLGTSVAIAGEVVVAGAPLTSYTGLPGGGFAGGGYLFSRGNETTPGFFWGPAGRLEVSDPLLSHLLGQSADVIWGPPLGALGSPDAENKGAVFIYDVLNPGLNRTEIVHIPNPESFGDFGAAVALDGSLLAIGDPEWNDYPADLHGAVYLYSFNGAGYDLLARLHASDTVHNLIGYGWSTALDDGNLATGAPGKGIPSHEDWVYINEMANELFSDGFETGDMTAWTTTSP